jgi:hypothetical protein
LITKYSVEFFNKYLVGDENIDLTELEKKYPGVTVEVE